MLSNVQKLISIGGPALNSIPVMPASLETTWGEPCGAPLRELLSKKNGFYAFEGALHVFPSESSPQSVGLSDWNHPALWRDCFPGMSPSSVCFAEDIFGVQFCIDELGIGTFDPETGDAGRMCGSMEEWAKAILSDYDLWTGHALAREWQLRHGGLPNGMRLVPIVPFVMGGAFEISNLHLLDAVVGQRMRGEIAAQIRGLPDGAQVRLVAE